MADFTRYPGEKTHVPLLSLKQENKEYLLRPTPACNYQPYSLNTLVQFRYTPLLHFRLPAKKLPDG